MKEPTKKQIRKDIEDCYNANPEFFKKEKILYNKIQKCLDKGGLKEIWQEAQKELLLEIAGDNVSFNCKALDNWILEKYKTLE